MPRLRADGPSKKIDPTVARRVVRLFGPYKPQVVLIVALVLGSAALGTIQPFLLRRVVDEGITKGNYGLIVHDSALSILSFLGSNGLGIAFGWISVLVGQRIMRGLRDDLFAHLQRMELGWFTRQKTGELQSRIANDVNGVQSVVSDTVANIFSNVANALTAAVTMLLLDWRLSLLAFAVIPLFAVLSTKVGNWSGRIRRTVQERLASLNATTNETLSVSGVLLTKVSGRSALAVERFAEENEGLTAVQIRLAVVMRTFFTLFGLTFGLVPVLVYWLAGWLIVARREQGLSLGTLVAFAAMQPRLFFPITNLLNVQVELASSLALFDRIFEYLDLKPGIVDKPGALVLRPADVAGRVTFEDVTFRYDPEAERPTLEGITLTAEPGSLVALVGPSGAGKSTLTGLIPRLYDVTAGRIAIDGHDLRDVTLQSLADCVAVVTQETYLVHDTVRENVRYGRPDADDAEIEAACRAAAIHDVIAALPDGYSTMVGERGYRLSGGERQRVAIARAILKNPRVLVLDEATSALDTESERRIQAALDDLMKDRTTFAVAHRLSTIVAADLIVVVENGRVAERGTHSELLAQGGSYARLYRLQFSQTETMAALG